MYVAGFERGVRPIGDWSMAISLSRCSSPSMRSCSPGVAFAAVQIAAQRLDQDVVDQRAFARAADTPVTQTNAPSGISTSTFLRLLCRAPIDRRRPVVVRLDAAAAFSRAFRSSRLPRQKLPGHAAFGAWRSSSAVPLRHDFAAAHAGAGAEIDDRDRPPASCLRRARRRRPCCPCRAAACSVSSSRSLSRGCRPIDGSSRMYSTPTRPQPIWPARRMRCDSPPESVGAVRSSVRYSSPTLTKKPKPAANFLEHFVGDLAARGVELQLAEELGGVADRQVRRPRAAMRLGLSANFGMRAWSPSRCAPAD